MNSRRISVSLKYDSKNPLPKIDTSFSPFIFILHVRMAKTKMVKRKDNSTNTAFPKMLETNGKYFY